MATDYERKLEDAVLWLWAELPPAETRHLRAEASALADFCAHLHHAIEHEQATVRRNVWSQPVERRDRPCAAGCGLAAVPGDRYCAACASARDRAGWAPDT